MKHKARIEDVRVVPHYHSASHSVGVVTTIDGHIYKATWAGTPEPAAVKKSFEDDRRNNLIGQKWSRM